MDLSFLRPLYAEAPGNWCSVYLDVRRDRADARSAIDLRWRGLAEDLRDQGADQPTLAAIGAEIHGERDVSGLAVFGRGGKVVLAVALPGPPPRDTALVHTLPHTLPLARLLTERVPWVRALVDRSGADLLAVTAAGTTRTAQVSDEEYPVRKTAPGGWSQARYQRSAEQNWDRTAAVISEQTRELANRVRARILVVAGDVRERTLVAERLAEELPKLPVVQTEAGSRALGAAYEPLAEATDEVVRAEAERLRGEVLDAYRREHGRREHGQGEHGQGEHGRAGASATGVTAVVSALRQGQVDTLLVDPDALPADGGLWSGPEPVQLGLTSDELFTMGVADPWSASLDDLLVRAAAATEADLLAVSADEIPLTDGIGARLRY